MKDWMTSSGIKKEVVRTEGGEESTVFKTTSVKVKKATKGKVKVKNDKD
jgi:hypothetical protein